MRPSRHFQHVLAGTSALIFAGAQVAPSSSATGPVLEAAAAFVSPPASPSANVHPTNSVAAVTHSALVAFTNVVRPLSHPQALESAFHSYFAFRAAHAQRLLPKLADGGLVFLFAPDATWLQHDPWVSATTD